MKQKKELVPAFVSIIDTIKELSNADYQLCQWVARKNPKDYGCYENAITYFLEDSEALFDSWNAGRIEMTEKQCDMLKTLYNLVEEYDMSSSRPDEDKHIINDPKWHKIRDYAKLVYDELIKE